MPYHPFVVRRGLGTESEETEVLAALSETLEEHGAALGHLRGQLERLEDISAKQLFWRRIATIAAVAGALFAAIRLTDIWLAVRDRRRTKR